MEHIKQQIEAFKQSAQKLANALSPENLTSTTVTLKLSNLGDSENFTEKDAESIHSLLIDLGFLKSSSDVQYGDGTRSQHYYLGKSLDFSIWFYVKESTDTEIDRLRKRLAELEGGE